MSFQNISLGITGNYLILIPLLVIVIIVAIFFYQITIPPLPKRLKFLLIITRAGVLVLLTMLMFEPLLRLINKYEKKPTIAILIDGSKSMMIKDGSSDRSNQVREFIKTNKLNEVNKSVELQYYTFSSNLCPNSRETLDSIPFDGETTDLSKSLDELKDELYQKNIQAVVLVSDGIYNVGRNPIYSAEALSVPIFTIGVGDTNEQKDVLIKKVTTNAITYSETRLPINVVIKSSGYKDDNVEVTLTENSVTVDSKVINLLEGTNEYHLRLFAEPKEEGIKKYEIRVSKLVGELTDKNNSRTIYVKVLKSRLRTLIFAGSPSPDVSLVRQILMEDEHLTVSSFVQKSYDEFYEGRFGRPIVDSADCILFIGFPSLATSISVVEQLKVIFEQSKKPLLFIDGKAIDFSKLQHLQSFLPFYWSNINTNEILVFPSIAERMKSHPLILLNGYVTLDGWNNLPPTYKTQTVFYAKPESDILAFAKIQNVILNEPFILTRNINRQKSLAILSYGLWRWRLLTQGNSQTEKLFSSFISNAVRWLSTKEDDEKVKVTTSKEIFSSGEPIEFVGQVYSEQLKPVDYAELIVNLTSEGNKIEIKLSPLGNGQYEGVIDGLREGDYNYEAKAMIDGAMYGKAKGRFSVGPMNIEFIETKMNKSLLEQIAYRTGGNYYDIGNLDSLKFDVEKKVDFFSKMIVQTSEIELWNWKYFVGIIIFLLSFEWFVRKRNGML